VYEELCLTTAVFTGDLYSADEGCAMCVFTAVVTGGLYSADERVLCGVSPSAVMI
jgi:hypothetical protein